MESLPLTDVFAQGAIYLSLLLLTIYTLVLAYHWFSYGSSKKTSTTAMTIFLIGSVILFASLLSTYSFF